MTKKANNPLINRTPILENLAGEFTQHELVARSPRRMFTNPEEESKSKRTFHVLWYRCTVTGKCRQFGLVEAGGWVFNELRSVAVIELDEIVGEIIAQRKLASNLLEGPEHTWGAQWAEYYNDLTALEHKASKVVNAGLMS